MKTNNNHKPLPDKKELDKRHEMIERKMDTPLIPDKAFDHLPKILQDGCNQFTVKRERDMFLLGSLVLISGCLQNVYSIYDKRKVFCPIYAMVIAPPASGKGVLLDSLKYIESIQQYYFDTFTHQADKYKSTCELAKSDESICIPKKPVQRRLVLPANSSSAAFMKLLKNSNGEAIIFETEADSLSATLKNDWGNYSDILRKAFHHEPITASRIDDETHIDIKNPKLAILISGTLDQVSAMKLDDPVNGLQSRFLFYFFDSLPKFKNVSPFNQSYDLNTIDKLGPQLLNIYNILERESYEVRLTESHWNLFLTYFQEKVDNLVIDYNVLFNSMMTRHGLMAYRLLMVMTTLRHFEKEIPSSPIFCSKEDILVVYHLMETFIQHGTSVFHLGQKSEKDLIMSQYMEFFKILPDDRIFSRHEAIELGAHLFSSASIDRRLNKLKKNGLLISSVSGSYQKV